MPLADALSSLSTSINEQARTNVAKYAESLTVVRSSGQELHSLVFYGKPGSGKTSLATTVFKQIICNGLVDSALWVNSSDLPTMVRATYGTSTSEDDVIDKYKMTDLLLLDDFGRGNITKHAEDLTYRVMDYRYRWDLPLIVTTNDDPRELVEKFDMAVVQRVASTAAWIRMDALKRGIKLEEWEK
jgi:DNA replication protein DnaC